MVFQKPNPFPKSIYDNIAFGPRVLGVEEGSRRAGRAGAPPRCALGRGQEPAEGERLQPLGRPAAAPLHRALPRGRAGRAAHGRAGLRARPDLDDGDRGPHARPQARVHDRDRHPQHAAGRAGRRHDGVLQRRGRRGAGPAHRHPRRVRRRRRRSSPTPPTSGRRTTSRGGSDEGHAPGKSSTSSRRRSRRRARSSSARSAAA